MKKHKFLAVFLSVFLGATTMFTACSEEPDTGKEDPDQVPLVTIDYKERVEAWSNYLEYDEEEFNDFKLPTCSVLAEGERDNVFISNVNFASENGFYIVTTIEESEELVERQVGLDNEVFELYKTTRTTKRVIYNFETNEQIASYTGKYVAKERLNEAQNGKISEEEKDYRIDYAIHPVAKGIFCVQTSKYVTNEQADTQLVSTYQYFDLDKNSLSDKLEALAHNVDGGQRQVYVTIADTTYVLNDGKIVETFDKGFELEVPYYNNAVEIGEYAYIVNEQPLQAIAQSGDLGLVTCPGSEVKVINKDFDITVDYKTDGDAVLGFGVLSNGDILFSQYSFLDKDATEFDVEMSGMKLDVENVIVDVKTGAATDMNKDYVISTVYSNATELFASGYGNLSDATLQKVVNGAKVKDGYFLAEIQKITDKNISTDRVKVILDNNLEIVQELPNIIESQFGYVGYINETQLLVTTLNPEDKMINYVVNKYTGEVNLFLQPYAMNSKKDIRGGFILAGKVYSDEFKEVYDITKAQESASNHGETMTYQVVGDAMLIFGYKYDYESSSDYNYTVIAYVEGGNLVVKQLDSDKVHNVTYPEEQDNDSIWVEGSLILYRYTNDYASETIIYDNYGNVLCSYGNSASVDKDEYGDATVISIEYASENERKILIIK